MKPVFHSTPERGASLIFTVVLLAVLSIVGVAAVTLSSQERINAATQLSYQSLVECANAAQAKFWADLSAYGPGYLNPSPVLTVTEVRFPDGRTLDAESASRALRPCVDAGFTSFDMADHYGSAEIVASHLREGSGAARPVQLLTKWVPKPGPLTLADARPFKSGVVWLTYVRV